MLNLKTNGGISMETKKLIKKIYMDCPLCDKTHEIKEYERLTTMPIKGIDVTYIEHFYLCDNIDEEDEDGNEFVNGKMMDENLLHARDAYRQKKELLTSNEIIQIRKTYDLSQVDLAKLLGWGEATISRYETKAIQDETHDSILRLIRNNPLETFEFFKKNANKFSPQKKSILKEKIIEKINSYGKEFLTRQTLRGDYVIFDQPSDANGFTLLNIDKIEAIASYLSEKIHNLFKVKFMKMLWYTDVLSYAETGHAITGLVYRHDSMGALPIGHYHIMNLENINVKEEMSYNYDSILHIYPQNNINDNILTKQERAILDKVIEKFKDFKTNEIVNYMHEEKAYTQTTHGEIISFYLAKDIKIF